MKIYHKSTLSKWLSAAHQQTQPCPVAHLSAGRTASSPTKLQMHGCTGEMSLWATGSWFKMTSPDGRTGPTSPWWSSIKPFVEYHNPTSRLRHPKAIPFPLGGRDFSLWNLLLSLPWGLLLALKTKRAIPATTGFHPCLISRWIAVCLAPAPVLLLPEGPRCLPWFPSLGHKSLSDLCKRDQV